MSMALLAVVEVKEDMVNAYSTAHAAQLSTEGWRVHNTSYLSIFGGF